MSWETIVKKDYTKEDVSSIKTEDKTLQNSAALINYILSLENFIDLQNKKNFDKYKIFDYRINNQLILK